MPKTNIEKTVEENKEEWKDRFDNAFSSNYLIADEKIIEDVHKRLKYFIEQLLTSQAQMMVDIVEGKKYNSKDYKDDDPNSRYVTGYDKACEDILTSYKERGLIK